MEVFIFFHFLILFSITIEEILKFSFWNMNTIFLSLMHSNCQMIWTIERNTCHFVWLGNHLTSRIFGLWRRWKWSMQCGCSRCWISCCTWCIIAAYYSNNSICTMCGHLWSRSWADTLFEHNFQIKKKKTKWNLFNNFFLDNY